MAKINLDDDENLLILSRRIRLCVQLYNEFQDKSEKFQVAQKEFLDGMSSFQSSFTKLKEILDNENSQLTLVHSNPYNPNLTWLQKGLIVLDENRGTGMSVVSIIDYIKKHYEPNLSDAARVGLSNALSSKCESPDSEVYRIKHDGNFLYFLSDKNAESTKQTG